MKNTTRALVVFIALFALLAAPRSARAQEVQITGPLAGAKAVRRLRLHRAGRFEFALNPAFTILDEFRRDALFGARASYFFTDWIGVSLWGAGGVSWNTGLAEELQTKAVDNRNCAGNPFTLQCRLTAVSLCRGPECLQAQQFGSISWMIAPQLTFVPFRGKFSLFGKAFMDADISLFLGPAIIGLKERATCGTPDSSNGLCTDPNSFSLNSRTTATATFGLGLNFYPTNWMSFGGEFRATPFQWNTGGFDVGSDNGNAQDNDVTGNDRKIHVNPMIGVSVGFQFPTKIKVSD